MLRPTALSIGNFDGVHRGHAELLLAAREAVGRDGRVIAIAFDPHPLTLLRPDAVPARLTTFEQRRQLLTAAGADEAVALRPSRATLGEQAESFIERLVREYRPTVIVEGPDFRFGHRRAGSIETLRRGEAAHGYETIVIDPVEAILTNGHVLEVSSTLVRWLVERGRMRDAEALLGRSYELVGTIVPGDRRGRALGVPTANLDHGELLLPGDGIYVGRAEREGRNYAAAISVGTKPTFGTHPRLCEAHLIGYDGPLDDYGWSIRITVLRWLRDQIRYDGVEPLIEQLGRDIARAESVCAGGG